MNTILNLVLKLYNCITNIVYACANIVKYCSNFVQILREKKIVQIMYKNYVRVLYKYCVKDILQILCKYCTNIVQKEAYIVSNICINYTNVVKIIAF